MSRKAYRYIPSSKVQRSSWLRKLVGITVFSLIVFSLAILGFARWFDQAYSAELHTVLAQKPPVITVLSNNGTVLAKKGARHANISIDKLPPALLDAVIATEDRRFFVHHGVDPQGIARALWSNLTKGRYRQGGSTLTQQLVKNVFLTRKRTILRKFRELVITFWIENHYSKQQILEFYFNRVYFGAGARQGIEAASHAFFDKSASELSLAEAALMAGLLKAPTTYSPLRDMERANSRAAVVLQNMLATGAIDEADVARARQWPAKLNRPAPRLQTIDGTEYALDFIWQELRRILGPIETDITVKTTLDLDWQTRAQKLVFATLERHENSLKVDQAASVLLDKNGAIKLLIGGKSYADSQFNRAIKAKRQPGSSFKPFVYLAAMENGRTPDSVEVDEYLRIGRWRPRNAGRFHRGPVTLRTALEKSINTVAVKLAQQVGLERVQSTAQRLGINSKLKKHPSLALGSSEVTPLEITSAYVPFMNGGYKATPHIIAQINDHQGVIFDMRVKQKTRVISSSYIYDMNDMLGAVVREGTGRRAALQAHASAGKTGTSQDYRDAWFLGYTGHFTCGVWMGNDDNSPTNKVSGGKLPALLWKQIMQMAHKDREPRPLPGLGRHKDGPKAVILDERLPADDIIVSTYEATEMQTQASIIEQAAPDAVAQ